jgi:U4/U6.U5 tri-snRNP-associated protein 1
MTPKEAFRQLCYKFHGIKASKNKQEKRIKKYLEEQKILEKNNTTV